MGQIWLPPSHHHFKNIKQGDHCLVWKRGNCFTEHLAIVWAYKAASHKKADRAGPNPDLTHPQTVVRNGWCENSIDRCGSDQWNAFWRNVSTKPLLWPPFVRSAICPLSCMCGCACAYTQACVVYQLRFCLNYKVRKMSVSMPTQPLLSLPNSPASATHTHNIFLSPQSHTTSFVLSNLVIKLHAHKHIWI